MQRQGQQKTEDLGISNWNYRVKNYHLQTGINKPIPTGQAKQVIALKILVTL